MNSLTLFLYIADVLYKQLAFIWLLLIGIPIFYLTSRTFLTAWSSYIYSWDSGDIAARKAAEQSRPFITTYKPFVFCAVGIFFVNLIPSQDTFYLMAASEAGEMVVKTPEAQEVLSDLKEIINIQLKNLKGQ